jgi:hypothetical protein
MNRLRQRAESKCWICLLLLIGQSAIGIGCHFSVNFQNKMLVSGLKFHRRSISADLKRSTACRFDSILVTIRNFQIACGRIKMVVKRPQ